MTDTEIRVLEKGLDISPIQNKINEPKLRTDFKDFCRRMCITWHFRNEPSPAISEIPSFSPKSSRKPPRGHPNLVRYYLNVKLSEDQLEMDLYIKPTDRHQ